MGPRWPSHWDLSPPSKLMATQPRGPPPTAQPLRPTHTDRFTGCPALGTRPGPATGTRPRHQNSWRPSHEDPSLGQPPKTYSRCRIHWLPNPRDLSLSLPSNLKAAEPRGPSPAQPPGPILAIECDGGPALGIYPGLPVPRFPWSPWICLRPAYEKSSTWFLVKMSEAPFPGSLMHPSSIIRSKSYFPRMLSSRAN